MFLITKKKSVNQDLHSCPSHKQTINVHHIEQQYNCNLLTVFFSDYDISTMDESGSSGNVLTFNLWRSWSWKLYIVNIWFSGNWILVFSNNVFSFLRFLFYTHLNICIFLLVLHNFNSEKNNLLKYYFHWEVILIPF